MAEIKKVGVLGAGLMGHGIAQVSAQAGYDVVLREVDDAPLAKGIGQDREAARRAVEKGKATQEDADAVRGRIQGDDRLRRPGRLRPRASRRSPRTSSSSSRCGARSTGSSSPRPSSPRTRRRWPSSTRRRRRARPDALRRPALLQPRAGDEARRGRARRDHVRRGVRDGGGVRQAPGQAGRPDARQGRLHRQPPARALHARRDAGLRGGRRLGRARSTRR